MAARTILVALAFALVSAPTAAPHSHIPDPWWIDQPTALAKLREAVKMRYEPSAYRTFTGRCQGRMPPAVRDGRRVYKHYTCRGSLVAGSATVTFLFNIHVIGPRGRITVGG